MKIKGATLLGFVLGLALPILAMYAFSEFRPELLAIQKFEVAEVRHLNMQLMTLSMLPNVAAFFIALRLENEDFGRGLVAATLLLLIAVFIYRFLL
jgi:uncharacterized membrane protein YozB (DUF420 family)